MPEASSSPVEQIKRKALTRYQQRWLYDKHKRKLLVKARRIGGTEIVTLESAWKAAGFDPWDRGLVLERGEHENLISASQGQSSAMLSKYVLRHIRDLEELPRDIERMIPLCRKHGISPTPEVLLDMARAAEKAKPNGGSIWVKKPKLARDGLVAAESSERLLLINGREIRAFAANPRTIRGFEGNVTLDEFGAMPYSEMIWAAASPVADPNLANPQGYALRVIGTPLGDANQFYKLAMTDEGKRFSRHRVSIYDAVQDGFPIDPEEKRRDCGNEEIFQQEYGCIFLSAAARYLSAELLDRATYADVVELRALLRQHGWGMAGVLQRSAAYGGLDVARSETGDYCALARNYKLVDTYWCDEKITAQRGVSYQTQAEWVAAEIRAGVRRLCVDATGIGSAHAEALGKAHPGKIEGVTFTAAVKEDLATTLKQKMETGRQRIPADPDLRRDLLNLRRLITTAGNTRFDVERDKNGHGDRAWALMLALHAGEMPVTPPTKMGYLR